MKRDCMLIGKDSSGMEKLIYKAMDDLLQRNIICNYIIKTLKEEIVFKKTHALTAYLYTVKKSNENEGCNVSCYMAPLGEPALSPIFEVRDGNVMLSGLIIAHTSSENFNILEARNGE